MFYNFRLFLARVYFRILVIALLTIMTLLIIWQMARAAGWGSLAEFYSGIRLGTAAARADAEFWDGSNHKLTFGTDTLAGDITFRPPPTEGSADDALVSDADGTSHWSSAVRTVYARLSTSDSVAGNESGEQALVFTGSGNDTWSANTIGAGRVIDFDLGGLIQMDADGGEKLRIRVYVDGTSDLLADSGTLSFLGAQTNAPWTLHGTYTQDSVGGSGAYRVTGLLAIYPDSAVFPTIVPITPTTGTLDTTVSQDIPRVTVEWTSGDAADTCSLDVFALVKAAL